MTEKNLVLEMKGIKKRFGGTHALKGVDITLKKGEVLGLIGENGAGKSTLMKILSGVYSKDNGKIFLDGKQIEITSTENAQQQGIGIIYQELSVFLDLDVVGNMFIHREITRGKNKSIVSKLNKRYMRKEAERIFANELGIQMNLEKTAYELTLAQRQLIEIARSLCSNSQIIIMDEPTTALEEKERENLFKVIRKLKENGTSIIYVSHQLEEVLKISDRVMVLRDGLKVADEITEKLDVNKVISYMIGKNLTQQYPKEVVELGDTILEIENLEKKGCFHNINFKLKRGQILGIAGLVGCGKNEVVRSIFGVIKYSNGNIKINKEKVTINNINDAKKYKIAFVPAERKTEGVFDSQDVNWNISIASLNRVSKTLIDNKKEKEHSIRFIEDFGIKTESINHSINSLSGGNQQKVMLARWLMTQPEILILEEPTRGIDVNAKTEVYKLIMKYIKRGNSVIIVSSEAPELLGICDNILVMHEGEITAKLVAKETCEEAIAYYSVRLKGGKKCLN